MSQSLKHAKAVLHDEYNAIRYSEYHWYGGTTIPLSTLVLTVCRCPSEIETGPGYGMVPYHIIHVEKKLETIVSSTNSAMDKK